jgi:hypothetical protein
MRGFAIVNSSLSTDPSLAYEARSAKGMMARGLSRSMVLAWPLSIRSLDGVGWPKAGVRRRPNNDHASPEPDEPLDRRPAL